MAGGKETPRQKMIGMMYLVLTALLALQVSNAVLEKFAIINETLKALVAETNKNNADQLAAIIQEGGASTVPKIKSAVDRAKQVREATTQTMAYIDNLKAEIMKTSGSTEVNEAFINDHSSKVATMMIDPRKPFGKEFVAHLDDYVKKLTELVPGEHFATLAKAPKDIPLFAADEDHANKDFLTFTFENTPPIAALASVTQIQTEVMEYEAQALRKLAEEAGAATIRFENIIPMVRPVSSVVAAGAPYEADMFISASSSTLSPEMAIDLGNGPQQVEVALDPTGVKMGKVKFTAQGGGYDANNMATKKFTALITLNDSTYRQEIEYKVAKPVIRVTTGSAPTLYRGACNVVNFEVPSLGASYNPNITATGAKVQRGSRPGQVTLIPDQARVTATVSNAGINLGSESFQVKNIPPPSITPMASGRPINLVDGVRAGSLTSIRIQADAEANFKEFAPNDATYRIRGGELILARGPQRVSQKQITSENMDINDWRNSMRPGDRIIIRIQQVTRFACDQSSEQVRVDYTQNIVIN